jgi:hypothetical protein
MAELHAKEAPARVKTTAGIAQLPQQHFRECDVTRRNEPCRIKLSARSTTATNLTWNGESTEFRLRADRALERKDREIIILSLEQDV